VTARKSVTRRGASHTPPSQRRGESRDTDANVEAYSPDSDSRRPGGDAPTPGDFVVIYTGRAGFPTPTVQLQRVQQDERPWLIRATFESADDAGPRFEAVARALAESARSRAWRSCLHTGLMSLLGS